MSNIRFTENLTGKRILQYISSELKTEVFRKVIHLFAAFVPLLAGINLFITQILLAAVVVVYCWSEYMRIKGKRVILISGITMRAARTRDKDGFVGGPVTMAVGTMLALILFPLPAASIAIYALAFGDSAASLGGKTFGRVKLPGFRGKTLEGSLSCFSVVFAVTLVITSDLYVSLLIAGISTVLELVPIKDLDNLMIPLGTGLAAAFLL